MRDAKSGRWVSRSKFTRGRGRGWESGLVEGGDEVAEGADNNKQAKKQQETHRERERERERL